MKIKINDKEIELTEEQIKILKEEVNSEKKGLWKPEHGEKYASINDDGRVGLCSWLNDSIDRRRYSIGNVYKTIEDAQAHVDKLKAIQRVKEYIAENCEVVEDVEDIKLIRWQIVYNIGSNKFFADGGYTWLNGSPFPYIKDRLDAQKVIDNCEADLKVIWGIK